MKKRRNMPIPSRKSIGLAVLLVLTAGILLYIRPFHIAIVVGFIVLISSIAYLISSYFLSRKDSIVAGIFVLLFLVSSFLSGFNVLNTILLASFIIGVKVLLR